MSQFILVKKIRKSMIIFAECIEISNLNEFTEKLNVGGVDIIFDLADAYKFEKCVMYENINIPIHDFNTFCSVIKIKIKEMETLKLTNFLKFSSVYDKINCIKENFKILEKYEINYDKEAYDAFENIKMFLNAI